LIRQWPRLTEWLREAREDIRLQQTISAETAEWERHGRPVDYLYRGTMLDEAGAWAERNTPSATEVAFIAAGRTERARAKEQERAQQARELELAQRAALANRRAANRLRVSAGVLGVFLVVAVGLAIFAFSSSARANAERNIALSGQL